MSDSGFSIDQNPGRWIVSAGGAILCEAGVQAMLTSQTSPLTVSIVTTAAGAVLILVAVFWNKLGLQKTAFFGRLNGLASHPALWITLAMVVWFTSQMVTALRELRLNNEIVQQRNDTQSIANVINRTVLPRHLTHGQQTEISAVLRQMPPFKVNWQILRGDEETSAFASELENAIEKGGWTLGKREYLTDMQPGLQIMMMRPQQSSYDWNNKPHNQWESPQIQLQIAFGLAGVRTAGGGGGSSNDITEDTLTILVGAPVKDAYDVLQPLNPFN